MEDLNIAGEGVDGEKQLKENVSYWKGISAAKTWPAAQPQAQVPSLRPEKGEKEFVAFLKRLFERLKVLNSSLWRENWPLNYLLYFKFTDGSSF